MTRFGCLVLALVVCLVGVASAETDCNEAQFWKSLVTHKVSAAQLTNCHEVVSIVTFAREARCMELVPAKVCSFAQQYCPGIECSVSFTLLDEENVEENEQDIETEAAVEEQDAEVAIEENFEQDNEEADIEEEIDEEFKAKNTNSTKKERKAEKKAEKKKAKEEKKAEKHQAKVEKHQKRAEAHNATLHAHNATDAHGHKVHRHGKSKLTVAGEEEAIDADVSALDMETMQTKLNATGPRPAPLLFLVFTLMAMVGFVALSVYRAKSRREGYRTLPDSGYL